MDSAASRGPGSTCRLRGPLRAPGHTASGVRPTCPPTSAISRLHRNERAGGIQSTDGIENYGEAKRRAVTEGIFPVANIRDIIASKKASNRTDIWDGSRFSPNQLPSQICRLTGIGRFG